MLLRSVALLHVVSSAAGQLYIDASLGCDSEGELVVNLEWVHEACAAEPFPDAHTPVPQHSCSPHAPFLAVPHTHRCRVP